MATPRTAKSKSKKTTAAASASRASASGAAASSKAAPTSETKGGLVSTKERDFLEQDDAIRGQRYACISFVSPEEVLVRKDVFVLNRFMQDISKDIDIMLTNLLKNVADTSVADTSCRYEYK